MISQANPTTPNVNVDVFNLPESQGLITSSSSLTNFAGAADGPLVFHGGDAGTLPVLTQIQIVPVYYGY
ncbi:hypothetical protein HDU76_009793, partial [Blyttiomyces sp. JEL0837]